MILIVDYGLGNLRSVHNALSSLGAMTQISDDPRALAAAEKIVLPGVGAFAQGSANLADGGWLPALEKAVLEDGKPFLGLCLGMQLLATEGTEMGVSRGLGWIPGKVVRLQDNAGSLRVPHAGWNDVKPTRSDGMYAGMGGNPDFYFIHSYVFRPENPAVISATCHYGQEFAASVEHRNIWAAQFHPEKSQNNGLRLLKNFIERGGQAHA